MAMKIHRKKKMSWHLKATPRTVNHQERLISKSNWLRSLISVLICFHLVVILVLPNSSSFLGRALEPWIVPYANLLGLNVTWNFFAPDPAHTMYINYFVH